MGFRYTGEGAFGGQRFDGMEEFAEANGTVVRQPKTENGKVPEQTARK